MVIFQLSKKLANQKWQPTCSIQILGFCQDLASRDVVSRAMTLEIREGRGVGPNKARGTRETKGAGGKTLGLFKVICYFPII